MNFSPSIMSALESSTNWLKKHEPWTQTSEDINPILERLEKVLVNASKSGENELSTKARNEITNILSYIPADMRILFIMGMAVEHGNMLNDILTGPHDRRSEPARHNIHIAIGTFARHALLADILSDERMERLEAIFQSQMEENLPESGS